MRKNQHVVPVGGQWRVCAEGETEVSPIFDTQREAIDAARKMAILENSELIFHRKDGGNETAMDAIPFHRVVDAFYGCVMIKQKKAS